MMQVTQRYWNRKNIALANSFKTRSKRALHAEGKPIYPPKFLLFLILVFDPLIVQLISPLPYSPPYLKLYFHPLFTLYFNTIFALYLYSQISPLLAEDWY